jgi:hypothetical protein
MRVVADLLPKAANINVEAGEAFVNLWRNISEGFGDELANHLEEQPPRGSRVGSVLGSRARATRSLTFSAHSRTVGKRKPLKL